MDQYALAVVAYELLAGTLPFTRDDPLALLYAHLSAPPPALTTARPGLPAAVDRVLHRALAKAPDDRYPTCGAFAADLRAALGVGPYVPAAELPPAGPRPAGPRQAATRPYTVTEPAPPVPPTVLDNRANPVLENATWSAVVTADRAHYDTLHAVDGQDAPSMSFPGYVPRRRFRLAGPEVRIGRSSTRLASDPEIDLSGPPLDPGVSRQHARLIAARDGTWCDLDEGSPNGIWVNGVKAPPRVPVPLTDGDRIHLGTWTLITITRD